MTTTEKIYQYINEKKLFNIHDKIIVTLSGGADSMALMHILWSLGYDIVLAHCNFHLRGDESNQDENFVTEIAKSINLPLYIKHFDTFTYARENRLSIELAARELRYNWFFQLASELNATVIATGHHADDNIETILMNLTRGTGLKGLTGIPPKNGKIVRPLLETFRKEIEQYLFTNKINFVTDSTNLENDYQRNKIRNVVIPLLEKINASVKSNIFNSIGYFNDAYDIYKSGIEDMKNDITIYENNVLKIDFNKLNKQNHIHTILFEILQPYGFSTGTIKLIAENMNGESGKKFFSESHVAVRDRNQLIVSEWQQPENKIWYINKNQDFMDIPIKLNLKKTTYTSGYKIEKSRNKIYVDLNKLKFPLQIRHWKEGDYFQPFGMEGKKKLSDFFIDQKMSLIEKEQCLLLLSDDNIVWVIGHRADDRFKIDTNTTDILEISNEQ